MGKLSLNSFQFFRTMFNLGDKESYTPTPIISPSHKHEYTRFTELLPYMAWDSDNQLFILEGASPEEVEGIGFCIEIAAQTGASEENADLLATMFNYFPKGSGIQFSLLASPVIEDYLKQYCGIRLKPEDSDNSQEANKLRLYNTLTKKLATHFQKGAREPLVRNQPYLLRNYRIVMSVVIPADKTNIYDENFISNIVSIRETVITNLKTYHQYDRTWAPEDLINWCSLILNPQETFLKNNHQHINYDDGKMIKEQIIFPDTVVRVTEDGLLYGLPQHNNEIYARTMSIRSYPKAFTLNAMESLIGDQMQSSIGYSSPYMITLGITTVDYEETRAATQMKSARATQKAESPMAKYMPDLIDIKKDWDIAQNAFDEFHEGGFTHPVAAN